MARYYFSSVEDELAVAVEPTNLLERVHLLYLDWIKGEVLKVPSSASPYPGKTIYMFFPDEGAAAFRRYLLTRPNVYRQPRDDDN